MIFTEEKLREYALPLSDEENLKCKHAIWAIRDALRELGYTDDNKPLALLEEETYAYSVAMKKSLTNENITIFIQGSYANNTCVRGESDVDIAVVHETNYEKAYGQEFGSSTDYKRAEAMILKNAVERVLKDSFPGYVCRENKSIKVEGNTYRKKADVVPCVSMHYYHRSHLYDFTSFKDGIVIYADNGEIIRNFPKQHIANGKTKNNSTDHYYKKMVRIIKKIRYQMQDYGYRYADKVSSFGLESLLWNLPDSIFMHYISYKYIFAEIVRYLYNNKGSLSSYKEANGIKRLCPTQEDELNYRGFIDQLYSFYKYE